MLVRPISDKFVCMDDISGYPEKLNYVVFNPLHDTKMEASAKLFEKIKERFGIELTSTQLMRLISYDVHQLPEFVDDLREIVYDKK